MKWAPSTLEDLRAVRLQPVQAAQDVRHLLEDDDVTRGIIAENSQTMFSASGEPLACFGVWPQWQGVGVAWGLVSEKALEHGIALARQVKRLLLGIEEDRGYWRIQATVERNHHQAARFLLWLGFEFEGCLRSYGPTGLDHLLYARVRRNRHG